MKKDKLAKKDNKKVIQSKDLKKISGGVANPPMGVNFDPLQKGKSKNK